MGRGGGCVSQGLLTTVPVVLSLLTFPLLDTFSLGVAEHSALKAGQREALLARVALTELLGATLVRDGCVPQAVTQAGAV